MAHKLIYPQQKQQGTQAVQARQTKTPSAKKSNPRYNYNYRCSKTEKAALKAWIEKHKDTKIRRRVITESSIVRAVIRWLIKKDFPIESEAIAEMRRLRLELHKIGTNLNQLTHAYNANLIEVPINMGGFFGEMKRMIKQTRRAQAMLINQIEHGLDNDLGAILKAYEQD